MSRLLKDGLLALVCVAIVALAALFATGRLPYRLYVVHTGSMTPAIPSRSAALVHVGTYHLGQVISFETVNGVVTHRLIKRNADGTLVTKGDANRTPDPWTLKPSAVIGGVVHAPRMLGYWLVYLKNPAGAGSAILAIVCFWLTYSVFAELGERSERSRAAAPGQRRATPSVLDGVPPSLFADGSRQGPPRAGVSRPPKPKTTLEVPTAHATPPAPTRRRVGERDAPGSAAGGRPAVIWRPSAKNTIAFRCSHCGATLASGSDLRTHLAAHHERPVGLGPRLVEAASAPVATFVAGRES